MKLEFSQKNSEIIQILNFIKLRPVGAELFHVNWQMHRRNNRHDEATTQFSTFL
jgi:hypothetical protein